VAFLLARPHLGRPYRAQPLRTPTITQQRLLCNRYEAARSETESHASETAVSNDTDLSLADVYLRADAGGPGH
jgi:hypothetical protein